MDEVDRRASDPAPVASAYAAADTAAETDTSTEA
jgi:hypothetical protein